MITHGNSIEILAGNSNKPLAEAIAKELKISLSNVEVGKWGQKHGEYKKQNYRENLNLC